MTGRADDANLGWDPHPIRNPRDMTGARPDVDPERTRVHRLRASADPDYGTTTITLEQYREREAAGQ